MNISCMFSNNDIDIANIYISLTKSLISPNINMIVR